MQDFIRFAALAAALIWATHASGATLDELQAEVKAEAAQIAQLNATLASCEARSPSTSTAPVLSSGATLDQLQREVAAKSAMIAQLAADLSACQGASPVNVELPTIADATQTAGPPASGDTLTATAGKWTGLPKVFAYQWIWADTGAAIAGATGSTYVATDADVGHPLAVTVTASNAPSL